MNLLILLKITSIVETCLAFWNNHILLKFLSFFTELSQFESKNERKWNLDVKSSFVCLRKETIFILRTDERRLEPFEEVESKIKFKVNSFEWGGMSLWFFGVYCWLLIVLGKRSTNNRFESRLFWKYFQTILKVFGIRLRHFGTIRTISK